MFKHFKILNYISQDISKPDHIGDLILPSHIGQYETWT